MNNNIANLTEQQVLETLDIPDFRHLSKDKIITFFSMIPSMNSKVAQKAIEQFPFYANVVKEVVVDFMGVVNIALIESSKDNQAYYEACNVILTTLSRQLEIDHLSSDERKYIIDKLLEIKTDLGQNVTESKEHQIKLIVSSVAVVALCLCGSIAVLGVNSRFSLK